MSLRIEPLNRIHNRKLFECGDETVDIFLHETAMQDQEKRLSSTHVLIDPNVDTVEVIGFHTLTFTTVSQDQLPNDKPKIKRSIPIVLLGQLGIDRSYQGRGLGDKMLTDAQFKVFEVASRIFIRAIVLDARTERLARWYESHEFTRFPGSLRMVKHIDEIQKLFI